MTERTLNELLLFLSGENLSSAGVGISQRHSTERRNEIWKAEEWEATVGRTEEPASSFRTYHRAKTIRFPAEILWIKTRKCRKEETLKVKKCAEAEWMFCCTVKKLLRLWQFSQFQQLIQPTSEAPADMNRHDDPSITVRLPPRERKTHTPSFIKASKSAFLKIQDSPSETPRKSLPAGGFLVAGGLKSFPSDHTWSPACSSRRRRRWWRAREGAEEQEQQLLQVSMRQKMSFS